MTPRPSTGAIPPGNVPENPPGLAVPLILREILLRAPTGLSEHLGHPPGGLPQGRNVRNGAERKTVATDLGPVEVRTPRDRDASFEPELVAKRQTRLAGLDDKILGLYAGGMTVRDISEHLSELYGVRVGRDAVSRVTEGGARGRRRACSQPSQGSTGSTRGSADVCGLVATGIRGCSIARGCCPFFLVRLASK